MDVQIIMEVLASHGTPPDRAAELAEEIAESLRSGAPLAHAA